MVVPMVVPPVVVGGGEVIVDSPTTVIQESIPPATDGVESAIVATHDVLEGDEEQVPAEAYEVVRVADDYTVTILVDGQQTAVRLLGVEPPLVAASQGGHGVLPEVARHFVRNLLVGESVYLDSDPAVAQRDAEGTLVAYLHRAPDGLLINEELVRQGYAQAATDYPFQYQPQFAAYQRKAQADAKGIWTARSAGPE
ncbi:MAG: hypothetical protein A2V70_20995 [Planctomycetes bacterium RBG_13_63_9]|nr:MAG: hypothetical protein A2V70_20995 [Planctomycetes bacterium RBG_13_63_9]